MFLNTVDHWEKFINLNKPLIYVHIPKTAGSYAGTIANDLGIKNKYHSRINGNDNGISFGIFRDPVKRFESLLNYRLGELSPRGDFPKHLSHVYKDKSVSLNEIVGHMTADEILGFVPFRTLTYWSKNIDILITIDQLQTFLSFFGFEYDPSMYKRKKVSVKERGTFDNDTIDRINRIYWEDRLLYDSVIFSPII